MNSPDTERSAQDQPEPLTISKLVEEAYDHAATSGFWDASHVRSYAQAASFMTNDVCREISSRLMLIVSEAAEAMEDARSNPVAAFMPSSNLLPDLNGVRHKPEGFGSELADIVIRVADLAGGMGLDLEQEIRAKLEHNKTRPRMHGKAF